MKNEKAAPSTASHSARNITLLCKVVDNFGDIGVVYRLANALSQLPEFSLRLVVSDLLSFSKIAPKVNPQKDFQTLNGYQIFKWSANALCLEAFQKNPPDVIIECFQCGRPDWLEHLLFDVKLPHTTHIIMIDYLTAENYAEDFHLLPSITRSARVKKVNFMPGFTEKTGGLILDALFYEQSMINLEGRSLPPGRSPSVCSTPPSSGGTNTCTTYKKFISLHSANELSDCRKRPPQRPRVLFFSYEKNLHPAVRALKNYNRSCTNGKLSVLLANGAGAASFKAAYEKQKAQEEKEPFALVELPFLPQEEWDCILYQSQILFIRGEDSLSRACLSGNPFIWNAYPQSEDYQLVKVNALLEKLRPFFKADMFAIIKKCWNLYNESDSSSSLPSAPLSESEKKQEEAVTDFLLNCEKMQEGFKNFSKSLAKNGDLTHNLMTFILKNTTMETKS